MLRAGRAQIDPGGVDGAVPQHVGQLYDVAGGLIEGGGEQMPQIMGKDLRSRHARFFAQSFQDPPDGLSGEGPAVFGEEDLTGGDFFVFRRTGAASGTIFWAGGWCGFFPSARYRPARSDRPPPSEQRIAAGKDFALRVFSFVSGCGIILKTD